jgi:hypothetical protein
LQNFEHKKLIAEISKLDKAPEDKEAFAKWIKAEGHLNFLRQNENQNELVIYASGECTYIHTVAVSNDRLAPIDYKDLENWNFNPFNSIASYVTGGGRNDVWVERGLRHTGSTTLGGAMQFIFGRTFEGWSGSGRTYFDLHQEYEHLTGIHWRPEFRAYCRYNDSGDLEPVVTVTNPEDKRSAITLVSFEWEPLEEYLAASNSSLVRMFDFPLLRLSGFSGWSNGAPDEYRESETFFYHQKIMEGYAAYTRGIQIIRIGRPAKSIFTGITDGWRGQGNKKYVEFIAYDWRNGQVRKVSTDPSATTNYFNTEGNSLPFELSPAFFNPEVLLKYKADRDKYTVTERDVSCRAAWHLEGIDVNEAGQVHAYICYLRRLPYSEQLHWLSFNEPPKTSISERAITTDFKGEFLSTMGPLESLMSIIRHWHYSKVSWWSLRDEKLLYRISTPLTASRDEWAEAFMDLAKLVVEGFETSPIRERLDLLKVPFGKEDKTITLLEKLLSIIPANEEGKKLIGLRTVQHLRSKVKGHVAGSEAEQLAQNAIIEHETYANHFKHVCAQVAKDLKSVENQFEKRAQ